MPEGHTIHRLAAAHAAALGGQPVAASSPQGRFEAGAALIDGRLLDGTDAHGKHLFHRYGDAWLHVHLGLQGFFTDGEQPVPPVVGQVRLRLTTDKYWVDLRGPNACELVTDADKAAIHARLGPDPLRADADPAAAWAKAARSRKPVAELLLDQSVLAGVGVVYRSEVLFRAGINPRRTGI